MCSKVSQVLPEGSLGLPAQPVDAPVAAILSFLLQHLHESGQGVAVAGGGETGYRLGAHRGQLELAAQLADAVLYHAGCPSCAHPRRGQADLEQAVVDFQVRLPRQSQRRGFGHLGLGQVPHLRVVEGLAGFQQQRQGAVHRGFMVVAAKCRIRTYSTSARSPRHSRSAS